MTSAHDLINRLLQPFFGMDIASLYQSYHGFIDFTIYLIFFIAVIQFALRFRFGEDRTAKTLAIVIGIAMAIGMSFFSQRYGFTIGDIAPLAGLIFLALLGLILYRFIRGLGAGVPGAGAFSFLLIFFTIVAIVPEFYNWIIDKVPFIELLMSIAVIVAVFLAVKAIILKAGKQEE